MSWLTQDCENASDDSADIEPATPAFETPHVLEYKLRRKHIIDSTSSDHRAAENARHQVRRLLREDGVIGKEART